MIDLTLKECPFCGNPAEIVDSEPFSFMPNTPTKNIRCSFVSVEHNYRLIKE